jgi:hypothetical protein
MKTEDIEKFIEYIDTIRAHLCCLHIEVQYYGDDTPSLKEGIEAVELRLEGMEVLLIKEGFMNKHCEACAKRTEGILEELYSARALLVSVVTLSRDAGGASSGAVDDVLDNLLLTIQTKLSFVDEALREL